MALDKCVCGHRVSRQAITCPNCGHPIQKLKNMRGCFVLVGCVFMVIYLTNILSNCSNSRHISDSSVGEKPPEIATTQQINNNSEKITENEYGKDWPFSVPDGLLMCTGSGAVTFTHNNKTYGVNGIARGYKENNDINEIWKLDSDSEIAKYDIKQGRPDLIPKISIGGIIQRGLKLCK
jgi:hypothetical protein